MSSIWEDRPERWIRFDIEPDGEGSFVTWTLLGPEGALDEDEVKRRRHRLDELINGHLREAFDQ